MRRSRNPRLNRGQLFVERRENWIDFGRPKCRRRHVLIELQHTLRPFRPAPTGIHPDIPGLQLLLEPLGNLKKSIF